MNFDFLSKSSPERIKKKFSRMKIFKNIPKYQFKKFYKKKTLKDRHLEFKKKSPPVVKFYIKRRGINYKGPRPGF